MNHESSKHAPEPAPVKGAKETLIVWNVSESALAGLRPFWGFFGGGGGHPRQAGDTLTACVCEWPCGPMR